METDYTELERKIDAVSVITLGSINTDIVGRVPKITSKGGVSFGGEVRIGAGGKARNMAQMMSALLGPGRVAMVGKSSKDPYGLWKPPIEALDESGVNTDFIKLLDFEETRKYPGISLISVDDEGRNQIYVFPGVNEEFRERDVDDARILFESVGKNNGMLVLSLDIPLSTATYCLKKSTEYGLKSFLDPGGIVNEADYDNLLDEEIFLIKPNEHESKLLTGVDVEDFDSAKEASKYLLGKNVKNVLITAGRDGAYFFNEMHQAHIPIPKIEGGRYKDETGCGDQAMATLCSYLVDGYDIMYAARCAVVSGTLKFYRPGTTPVSRDEITKAILAYP
ncbi:MAG: PfkB family carbohydrate kinase [Candidatus Aenigmatarchaeota archaeon]